MTNKTGKLFPLLLILSFLFSGMIFAAEGDVVWTRTYNGSANDDDRGYGIAVDIRGNVYVTGFEFGRGESLNVWVRKYDPDGNEVWTNTHNGTANYMDGGSGIAVDKEGNVYVTGYEYVSKQAENIWVRKYSPDGKEVWTRTHAGRTGDDEKGSGIAVDGSGNVYVTGLEYVTGQWSNIWVRKYDSNGEELWTRTHNGASNGSDAGSGVAVDGDGNIYVTGYETVSDESANIWVRKYDSQGKELWTRTHNGTANSRDVGGGIAFDGTGSVYVTGTEYVSGQKHNVWVRKYNLDGDEVWTRTYNGLANDADYGNGIAIDGSGNVYVTGCEYVTGEGSNILVAKYDSDGNEVWTRTYNGTANGFDIGYGIAVDRTGNVYVAGFEYVMGEDFNIWVRKYQGQGGVDFEP